MGDTYIPAEELGSVQVGDLLDIHDSKRKLDGEPLRSVNTLARWCMDRYS